MSSLTAIPDMMATAATDLGNIGSTITAANATAASPTTGVVAAAADEVSAAVAAMLGAHGQAYQAVGAQAAAFHQRFVQALSAGAGVYAGAEAANASPLQTLSSFQSLSAVPAQSTLQTLRHDVLNVVNEPTELLLGRPLIGNGTPGGTVNGMGQPVGPGGILFGNGGTGGNTMTTGMPGGNGGPAGLFGVGGTGGQGGPAVA
jgi:PE family